jgi:hypothetical protein
VVREDGADGKALHEARKKIDPQNSGTLTRPLKLDFNLPSVKAPTRLMVTARFKSPSQTNENSWPIWVVPRPAEGWSQKVWLHPSVPDKQARELFPGVKRSVALQAGQVAVAARFDDALIQILEQGGRVLLLPDGQRASLPLNAHWFLRGAPYVPDHPLVQRAPRAFWIELQHFDLASAVIPDIKYLAEIDPVLMLWDTHDLKTIKTHGLIFETRIAQKGRLLVSAVNHTGPDNAAGRWLLGVFLDDLKSPATSRNALSGETWASLKKQLVAEGTVGLSPGMIILK